MSYGASWSLLREGRGLGGVGSLAGRQQSGVERTQLREPGRPALSPVGKSLLQAPGK